MRQSFRIRRRILVTCEGVSERGYAAFLQKHAFGDLPIALEAPLLAGGGFAAQAELTIRAWTKARREAPFDASFLLTDADVFGESPRDNQALQQLQDRGIKVVFQPPSHEALLLGHFEQVDFSTLSKSQAIARLRAHWPKYEKGRSAAELSKMIDAERVLKAANQLNDLAVLLRAFGIPGLD